MGKLTLRDELREIGDAITTNFYCSLEGEEGENGEELRHDDYLECWHCWGRHLIERARLRSKTGGEG